MPGPRRPENVRIADHQEAESLAVEWLEPACTGSGYVSHYIIEYCRLDHECGGCYRLLALCRVINLQFKSLIYSSPQNLRFQHFLAVPLVS